MPVKKPCARFVEKMLVFAQDMSVNHRLVYVMAILMLVNGLFYHV